MTLEFVRPAMLWGLLALPVLVWLLRRHPLARGTRGTFLVALRVLVLGLLFAALARPRTVTEVDEIAVAFVLDVSRSVPAAARDDALARVEAYYDDVPPDDVASLIIFGGEPALEVPFRGVRGREDDGGMVMRLQNLESRLDLAESDLAASVEFAAGMFPPDVARRIVLFSDGNQTRGDLAAAARALAAEGIRLDVVPLRYQHEDEVIVEGLHAPPEGQFGEPLQLRAVVSSQTRTRAEVRLLENGEALGDPVTVNLDRGPNVLRFAPVPRNTGVLHYELRITPEVDGNPSNNVGRAGVIVTGAPHVIVVTAPDGDESLADALQAGEVSVQREPPSKLPEHAARYVGVDTVVLNDIAAYRMTAEQMDALSTAVRELGVGLVAVGGPNSFGPGGWRGTPLEDLVPVDLDTTNKKTLPKGALVVVLHSIEFDSGNTWAVKICKSAIQGLHADDEAGITYYDHRHNDTWLFDLQPVGDKQKMLRLIEGVMVGDMISFQGCFALAEASLRRSTAAVKHILVISDGDPGMPTSTVLEGLAAQRVTTSTICIAPHTPGSTNAMRNLAKTGNGRFYELDVQTQLQNLPKLIIKEAATLQRASLREEPFIPLTILAGSPLLRGIEAWPELGGYVVTGIREGAETILLAHEKNQDPLLAAWHVGLGRSVAFTSDASGRWAKNWLSWDRYGPFWTQVVRSCAPAVTRSPFPLTVTSDGVNVEVALDARSVDGEPITDLVVEAALVAATRESAPISIGQEAAGRYVGRAMAPGPGNYLVRATFEHDGQKHAALATAAIDYAPEFRSLRSDEALLVSAARATGGRELLPGDNPFVRDITGTSGRHEFWPLLVILAGCLLVVEVTMRRLDFGLDRAAAWWKATRERRAAARAARPVPAPASSAAPPPVTARNEPVYTPDEDKARPEKKPDVPKRSSGVVHSEDTLDALKKARKKAEKRREWK